MASKRGFFDKKMYLRKVEPSSTEECQGYKKKIKKPNKQILLCQKNQN